MCYGDAYVQVCCREDSALKPLQEPHRAESLHFLQSCQLFGRVLDEYSTDTTAPQLRGRVSGGTTPESATPGKPLATGARRPS